MTRYCLILGLLISVCLHTLTAQDATVNLIPDSSYQTIAGFGGFGAKKVWWDTPPYYDQEYLNQVIDSLGCTFIRTQIYWDAEPVNDNNNPNVIDWSKFKFDQSTDNGKQFDFIRDLGTKGARLIATVWTPPVWMKGLDEFYGTLWGNPVRRRPSAAELNQNCSWCGGASGCKQVGGWLKPAYYEEFAEYLVVWVKKVKEETGVDVWAINIQNEPWFPNPFESCVVTPAEYADILKIVGERFAAEGLAVKLFGPEHMGEVSWGVNNEYIKEILEDESVKPYLSFFAVHSYVDGVTADYGSAAGWTALNDKIIRTHDKQLWMTETSDFEKEGYDLGFSMAKSLYLGLKFGHISGWIYWAMADYVIKNNRLTPLGRAFQQYYRFLRPGTVMFEASSQDNGILVVAGKYMDDIAIIMINNSGQDKMIQIQGEDLPAGFKMYRTSENEAFKQLPDVGTSGIPLKSQSITSLFSGNMPTGNAKPTASRTIIYPNPAAEKLVINNAQNSTFMLYDSFGRCLLSGSIRNNEEQLALDKLQTGVYVISLNARGRSETHKFSVIKQ